MERVGIRGFCRIMLISVRACEELDMCWCALFSVPIHADIMVFVVQDCYPRGRRAIRRQARDRHLR